MERLLMTDLLGNELQELVVAEKAMVKALPRLVKGVHTGELRDMLQARVQQGQEQVVRLESVLKTFSKKKAAVCAGMDGIIEDCLRVLTVYPVGNLRDTALLGRLERAEAYRVAAYSSCRDFARLLGMDEAEKLIEEGLVADDLAGKRLAQIALQVNAEAYVDGNSPDCFLKKG